MHSLYPSEPRERALAFLRQNPEGLTLTQLSRLAFGGRPTRPSLRELLAELRKEGRVVSLLRKPRGRRVLVWRFRPESEPEAASEPPLGTYRWRILTVLRAHPEGLSRSRLSRLAFRARVPSVHLRGFLDLLARDGLVSCRRVASGRRPAEVWQALERKP